MNATDKQEKLYDSLTDVDEELITAAGKQRFFSRKSRRRWWMSAIAAVMAVCLVAAGVWWPKQGPGVEPGSDSRPGDSQPGQSQPEQETPGGETNPDGAFIQSPALSQKVCLAHYPAMPPMPDLSDPAYEEKYDAWWNAVHAQQRELGHAKGLEPFFSAAASAFLTDATEENRVISPVNMYMALGMLAEVTGGESRQQILCALGYNGIVACRKQASDVWNANYRQDGVTNLLLGSSVWLSDRYAWKTPALQQLVDTYYASSYKGAMGTTSMDKALQTWLEQQTGGLLKDQIKGIKTKTETALALATTVYYKDQWSIRFDEKLTAPAPFHAPSGEVTCPFMHRNREADTYFWGKDFGAVALSTSGNNIMWLILPDKGKTPADVIRSGEVMRMLDHALDWKNQRTMEVNLSLPVFDVHSQLELSQGFANMGITHVLDSTKADFSPVADAPMVLSQIRHDVRVQINEEGIQAAGYTVMEAEGTGGIPENIKKIDFTLDRPFLFAVTGADEVPLFMGVVNNPA